LIVPSHPLEVRASHPRSPLALVRPSVRRSVVVHASVDADDASHRDRLDDGSQSRFGVGSTHRAARFADDFGFARENLCCARTTPRSTLLDATDDG
jgi:hypothetical protein